MVKKKGRAKGGNSNYSSNKSKLQNKSESGGIVKGKRSDGKDFVFDPSKHRRDALTGKFIDKGLSEQPKNKSQSADRQSKKEESTAKKVTDSLERKLGDTLNVKEKLATKANQVENKLDLLENRIDNIIEDKLNGLGNKVTSIEDKLNRNADYLLEVIDRLNGNGDLALAGAGNYRMMTQRNDSTPPNRMMSEGRSDGNSGNNDNRSDEEIFLDFARREVQAYRDRDIEAADRISQESLEFESTLSNRFALYASVADNPDFIDLNRAREERFRAEETKETEQQGDGTTNNSTLFDESSADDAPQTQQKVKEIRNLVQSNRSNKRREKEAKLPDNIEFIPSTRSRPTEYYKADIEGNELLIYRDTETNEIDFTVNGQFTEDTTLTPSQKRRVGYTFRRVSNYVIQNSPEGSVFAGAPALGDDRYLARVKFYMSQGIDFLPDDKGNRRNHGIMGGIIEKGVLRPLEYPKDKDIIERMYY